MRRNETTPNRRPVVSLVVAVVVLLPACATQFSPERVRAEIVRQTGQDPERVFELTLGTLTTRLVVGAVERMTEGGLPLGGLKGFELALYDTPEELAGDQPSLDFTRMPVHGWEPVVRTRDESKSAVVLIRTGAQVIKDLVLVAGDGDRAIYARLRGRLSPDLPQALGEAVQRDGPDGVRRELMSLAEPSP